VNELKFGVKIEILKRKSGK